MRKCKDLTNKKFNCFTVIKLSDKIGKRGEKYWECKCDCGKLLAVRQDCLTKLRTFSCGCKNILNLAGEKFGKLTVIEEIKGDNKRASGRYKGERYWLCQCDCGNTNKVLTSCLTYRKVQSCGCLRFNCGPRSCNFKGYGGISLDNWSNIKRSATQRDLEFLITIEQIWELFLKQNRKCALSGLDIQFNDSSYERSKKTASLDRIDSSKGYIIDNVQWVHKDFQKMKMDYNEEYFIDMCHKISDFQKSKQT